MSLIDKVMLLGRIWRTAAQVQVALWRHPLPDVAVALRAPENGVRTPTALLSHAVSRGLRIGPWRPRCLLRSLVLYRLLRAQGEEAQLIIGLRDQPTSSDAHAWVELAGRDVGPVPGGTGYQELTRYPRDQKQTAQPAP